MYSYSVLVYKKEEKVAKIDVEGIKVKVTNYIDDVIWLPFGVKKEEEITYEDLEEYYEERCFPREREGCQELLHNLGLDCYDGESICRVTHGLQFDDFIWLQFSDEKQVRWEEIKMRD